MTLTQRVERIEADNALIKTALAEMGDGMYRLTPPGRRPPALGQLMREDAGVEVRPTLRPEEVRA